MVALNTTKRTVKTTAWAGVSAGAWPVAAI
jgi:hypothetical protein